MDATDASTGPIEIEVTSTSGADRIAELYERHAPSALGFAYLVCGDREMAADAVQEAFERVMGRLGDLRSADAFGAYLRRTVLNVLRSRGRSRQRQQRRESDHALDPTATTAPAAAIGGRADDVDPDGRLWAAIRDLPERQRAAVACRYWLDLSERDTARVLRCQPGTVKSLLSRALASIREEITDV